MFQEDQNNRPRSGHRTTQTEMRRRSYVGGVRVDRRIGCGGWVLPLTLSRKGVPGYHIREKCEILYRKSAFSRIINGLNSAVMIV